jgi:hypothetical protein
MHRRAVLNTALAASAVIIAGAAVRRATMDPPPFNATLDMLARLRQSAPTSLGAWNPYQVFTHLAQSIDYSMTGYPGMKSALFRNTAGKAAFFTFSTAGAMTHNLAEPIPGAPDLASSGSAGDAIGRTISSLKTFAAYKGPLHPHFAYGNLDKEEYLAAHLMHINNHMKEIRA